MSGSNNYTIGHLERFVFKLFVENRRSKETLIPLGEKKWVLWDSQEKTFTKVSERYAEGLILSRLQAPFSRHEVRQLTSLYEYHMHETLRSPLARMNLERAGK